MAKLMKCISEPSANQYLPEPFSIGEKVLYIGEVDKSVQPESFRKQFVRIKRLKSKTTHSVAVKHFQMLGKKKK